MISFHDEFSSRNQVVSNYIKKLIFTILLRIIFIFPTLLYTASILSRALAGRGIFGEDADDDTSLRKFEMQLLIDGAFLGIINGFIVIFGIGQTGYGILLSFATVAIGLLGISAMASDSAGYTELFIMVLNIILFGQFIDLASFSFIASLSVIVALIVLMGVYLVRYAGSADSEETA